IPTDATGLIVFINRVTEQLTGWTEREATGRPVEEVFNIVCENTGNICENPVHKVLELGNIVELTDHTILIAKDGTRRNIADSGAPIRDRKSTIIGTVLVFRDVTLEKKNEAELLKVKKLESIGVLAGGIAHDFNNILAAILGNINLAAQYIEPESKAGLLLKEAEKASTRAKQLTQQLLTFSRGGEPVKSIESLPELIRESADFVLHGTNIVCKYDIPDNLCPVEVDRGQIGQVIQNLVLNSRHAMPEGGTITISCANVEDSRQELFQGLQDEKYVRISLGDTGVGIPESMLEKIFDPYFTTKQEGSGLGLAISHSIIKKHRGFIQAHSMPGQGTTFTFYLPAGNESQSEQSYEPETISATGGTILIMDDEEMFMDVATRMLEHLGFEVVAAENGEEAIARYRRLMDDGIAVAAIILDLTIPGGMGGKEAVHEIRRINPAAKVIASSGYSTDPVMAKYQDYGFSASVAKPFNLKELNRAINTALA
ncbi:MAG: ATP-binding protein, partial [Desulfobulbaceae bacterium]|nr:ATP-binding protein [Desulfobulbaceae bacterium]